jgi:hypothetical protein
VLGGTTTIQIDETTAPVDAEAGVLQSYPRTQTLARRPSPPSKSRR